MHVLKPLLFDMSVASAPQESEQGMQASLMPTAPILESVKASAIFPHRAHGTLIPQLSLDSTAA